MRRRTVVVGVAALLLALPACGGGDATAPAEGEVPPGDTGPAPPGGFAEDQVDLSIEDQETNDITGTASFLPEDEASTRVMILLDVPLEGGGEAEIRGGRCEEVDARVTHELGELEDGQLDTVVDTALEDLLAAPHALWTVPAGDGAPGCALIAPFGVDVD